MAAAAEGRKKRRGIPTMEARELLRHPWRIRVLEALHQRDMSVSQCVDEGVIPDLANDTREEAISLLSYHFRVLKKAGLIEVVESIPSRGGKEYICRAVIGAHHSDEEWARLSRDERRRITPLTLSNFVGLAESAVLYDTFDNRIDRHLAYVLLELDEQGWSDLGPALNGMLDVVMRVREEAKERLEASDEKPIRVVWGQTMFESPPLSLLKGD